MPSSNCKDKVGWLLSHICDPEETAISVQDLTEVNLEDFFLALEHHGIEPIAMRHLKTLHPNLPDGFQDKIAANNEKLFIANALAMELEQRARIIIKAMRQKKLRVFNVKGPDFAANLYPNLSDRPFTDIDLLIHPDDLKSAEDILIQLGYYQQLRKFWDKSETNMEQKWGTKENANVLIEVHTNMVHDKGLRRRLSFGYLELLSITGSHEMNNLERFMISVIHGAAGHKYHKLQMLVDILQAFRKLDDAELLTLKNVSTKLSANLEVATSLHLIHVLFGDKRAEETRSLFQLGLSGSLSKRLLSANTIINTHDDPRNVSRLRRHAFRFLQQRSRKN